MTKTELFYTVANIRKYREHYEENKFLADDNILNSLAYVLKNHDKVKMDNDTYIYFTYILCFCDNYSISSHATKLKQRVIEYAEAKFKL